MMPKVGAEKARQEILAALSRLYYEATESELVVATGIPTSLVRESLRQLSRTHRCERHMRENGEISYRYARGLQPRQRYAAGRGAMVRRIKASVGGFVRRVPQKLLLFPLVGYFVLFVFLPLPPALLAFALVLASCWTLETLLRGGRGGMPSCPIAREPAARGLNRPASCMVRAMSPRILHTRQFGGLSAMHEAFYSYLFARGRREISCWKRAAARAVLDFLRRSKGLVSRAEIMGLTGLTAEQAGAYASELLRAYRGEPAVTEGGSVVYRFDRLYAASRSYVHPEHPVSPKTDGEGIGGPLGGDTRRFGGLITFMNGLNLLFGSFYGTLVLDRVATAVRGPAAAGRDSSGVWPFLSGMHSLIMNGFQYFHPLVIAAFLVGVVPAGFAMVYFALHVAAGREHARVERTMQRLRLRKAVYSYVLSHPMSVDPCWIGPGSGRGSGLGSREQVGRFIDELAVAYGAEIEDTGAGHYLYSFPELERQMHDLDSARLAARPVLLSPGSEPVRSHPSDV